MSSAEPVLVSVVTHDDEALLGRCLASVQGQTVPVQVKVFDNASRDQSRKVARDFGVEITASPVNTGYSGGHNRNLAGEGFDSALLLNADVILEPNFLEVLLEALQQVDGAGMAGGKLYRMDERGQPLTQNGQPLLDSTGIFFTPSQRHFDRGSNQPDQGQYDTRELVFGITGAALLCRRTMLEDLRFGDEYLDEDFFAYREDAELAWRAQIRGWKAVYEPRARALHCRHVLPDRRRQLAPAINYHSLKNRYLMRMKNMDAAVRWRCFPHMWLRDLGILFYVLLLERSSLGAYRQAWRLRHHFRKKRQQVQSSRRARPRELAGWFAFHPTAKPVVSGGPKTSR